MEHMRDVKGDAGFSLLEVLIAMVILAIGLLGVAAMQVNAISGNAYGTKLNGATERIQNKMEGLRNLTYEEVVSEDEEMDDDGFTRKTIVQKDTPEDGVKTVEVQVSWTDQTGKKNHQIAFRTIISR
ncbi:prepilin-type N-terminal cleavage/methylation domain-containing protein [Desulfococcus sp.]|uniref:type IV pilus modification PilV family protein n=1 Tax=Desulfococcus sp. TaxID=2025834 RepID=UPI003594550C